MNKSIIALIAILILGGAIWALVFYRENLRGVGPAIKPPAGDITKLINTTGMPLKMPAGFSISIFAEGLVNPRLMTRDPAGNLIVSIPSEGKVVALPDMDSDGKADGVITLLESLNRPHGLAVRSAEFDQLFVAESDGVSVYDYVYNGHTRAPRPVNRMKKDNSSGFPENADSLFIPVKFR